MDLFTLVAGLSVVAGATGLVAGGVLATRSMRQARLVAMVQPTPAGELDAGLHEVRGALAGDGAYTSPVTGRPCLWFRLMIEQRVRDQWETVLDLREGARCTLEDASGRVALDLLNAEVVVSASERVRTGVFSAPSAELDALFAAVGAPAQPPRGPFVRWREEVLFAGDVLHAVGTASESDGAWSLGGEPFVVSDRDDAEVVLHQKRASRRWAAVAGVGLVAMGWGAWGVL